MIEISTSSYRPHSPDESAFLRDLGFTTVVTADVRPNRSWEHCIKNTKKAGLKFIARFPDWQGLKLCQEPFLFKAYDGKDNSGFPGGAGVQGASYWHPNADERAISSLQPLVDMGIDGILASALVSDRMYPTDFYGFGDFNQRYTSAFWSFDDHAQAAWKEVSDQNMPEYALCGPEGRPPPEPILSFYRWYQAAWFGRIHKFADAAIDAGLKHVWTWWIPLDFWDPENMADATANSSPGINGWRRHVLDRGAESCIIVNACIFGLWDRWRDPGLDTMKTCNIDLGWTSIPGIEAWGADCFRNIEVNSKTAKEHGYCGMFAGDGEILNTDRKQEALDIVPKAIKTLGG